MKKWYPFDKSKGSRQKRPPVKKWVLVQSSKRVDEVGSSPPIIAVGYRKNGAGDKQSPYFVVPGLGGEVTHWCDCLPDDFEPAYIPR